MTNDLVSDMLTRIRNASLVRHSCVNIPYSKLNASILNVLIKEGFVSGYENEKLSSSKKFIKVFLKYKGWWIKRPFFSTIKRISKPGQRIFCGYKDFQNKITLLKYNQGVAIISTSSGIMSHPKAKKFKKGGEIICYIG